MSQKPYDPDKSGRLPPRGTYTYDEDTGRQVRNLARMFSSVSVIVLAANSCPPAKIEPGVVREILLDAIESNALKGSYAEHGPHPSQWFYFGVRADEDAWELDKFDTEDLEPLVDLLVINDERSNKAFNTIQDALFSEPAQVTPRVVEKIQEILSKAKNPIYETNAFLAYQRISEEAPELITSAGINAAINYAKAYPEPAREAHFELLRNILTTKPHLLTQEIAINLYDLLLVRSMDLDLTDRGSRGSHHSNYRRSLWYFVSDVYSKASKEQIPRWVHEVTLYIFHHFEHPDARVRELSRSFFNIFAKDLCFHTKKALTTIIDEALAGFSADKREAYLKGFRYVAEHDPVGRTRSGRPRSLVKGTEVETLLEQASRKN